MRAAHSHPAYALSPLQQGMLSHHSGRQATGVDLVQIVFHLAEDLPPHAFTSAWQWVAARHDILRTAFRWGTPGEAPQQEAHARITPEIAWHDWRAVDAATRELWWTQLLGRDRARGFDLAVPPLWRVTVVQLGVREFRVLWSFHHLLVDARTLLVLLPELFQATADYAAGRRPHGPEALPYRAYIDWLATQDRTASASYWRQALAGFRTPTPLPLGGANPSASDIPAGPAQRTRRLAAAATNELQAFARAQGVTLNTLIQGAWAMLLSRYTGEDDVLFGAVRACRHASIDRAGELVGPLINTLPLRLKLPGLERVGEWLRGLRRQWVELRPHEHGTLSDIRGWSEIPAGLPLFETIVSYQEPAWDDVLASRGGAWAQRHFEVLNQINHPLALDAASGAELQLRISYDATRFTPATIDRMLGHLEVLLRAFATDASAPLATLPLLTAGEEKQILGDWRGTTADFGAAECLHVAVARQAALTPTALAVADRHDQADYASLVQRAGHLAAHFRAHGVGPNTFVGVCAESSVELVVALLAVLQAGGAYVPMDPAYPAERLAFMLQDAGVPLLLTTRALAPRFADLTIPVLVLEETALAPAPEANVRNTNIREATPDDLAYLIYTSGSTGQPKGVPIRHRHVANLIGWHQRIYGVQPADRASQLASPAFDACVWEIWPYLTAGASVHIPPSEVRVAPDRLVHWLAAFCISICFLPTPLAEAVLDEAWPADTSLRAILTGGDRLRRWPGKNLPCVLVNHYGPTENTVVSTWTEVPAEADGHAAPAIGRALPNTEIYVLDRAARPVPVGVPGELYVGGASLADGYHNRPELTAEKFVAHPFDSRSGAKLYRTGDLVRWREDGQIDYLGRIDQQVKIRGHRIEPGEIESVLNAEPGVRESLVVARPDATGQPQLVAYLLPRVDAAAPEAASLAQALHRRLPAYMVPAHYVVLDTWPLTPNGKVDRNALPAPAAAPAPKPASAPRAGTERTVAGVWGEVLGRPDIGAYDDFFELGGHSLRAAQVISRLNAALHTSLSVRHLFENSTVAGLAAVIDEQRGAAPASVNETATASTDSASPLGEVARPSPITRRTGALAEPSVWA